MALVRRLGCRVLVEDGLLPLEQGKPQPKLAIAAA